MSNIPITLGKQNFQVTCHSCNKNWFKSLHRQLPPTTSKFPDGLSYYALQIEEGNGIQGRVSSRNEREKVTTWVGNSLKPNLIVPRIGQEQTDFIRWYLDERGERDERIRIQSNTHIYENQNVFECPAKFYLMGYID